MIIYDIEIAKAIPPKDEPREPDLEYCEGWGDHLGMGIAVIGVFDFDTGLPRIFMKDNIDELWKLMDAHDVIAGFNSKHFDNKIMAAHGYDVPDEKTFDLYLEIKEAAGAHKYAKGYNLDNCCYVNLGIKKSGHGSEVPALWQRGQHGQVIDYGLRDIMISAKLLQMAMDQPLLDPANPGTRIFVKSPL